MKMNFKKIGINRILTALVIVFALTMLYTLFFRSGTTGDLAKSDLKFVSGTAYISGETGQSIVRLSDKDSNPIENAQCNVTVLYPDKNYFLLDVQMGPSTIPGNYYKNFMTPTQTGLYEEIVKCVAENNNKNITLEVSSSFQVSIALNMIVELSNNQTTKFDKLFTELDLLKANITNVNTTLSNNLNSIGDKISQVEDKINSTNATVTDKFKKFYQSWSNVSQNMFNVFNQ